MRRLKLEILEQQQQRINEHDKEPLFDIIHGLPGTGKSRVIQWMRRLMEEGLGWEHGVQFICLAFQNSMAAAIGGLTIHHWSGIPARSTEGNKGDKHRQSIKCQALMVIVLNELSMLSAELLGALQYVIQKAIRVHGAYKKRADGSTRYLGGVNAVMCADFWQLQPVFGIWLCSHPTGVPRGRAHDALAMLWETGCDTIRKCWTLVELMRCRDDWYNNFLQ